MSYGDPYTIKLWRVPCTCGHDWWTRREIAKLLVLKRVPRVLRQYRPFSRYYFQPKESEELKQRVQEYLELFEA